MLTDSQLLDQEIARFTPYGWQVVNRSESSVQLRKPRQMNALLLIIGLIGLILVGLGLILIIIALADYGLQQEQVIHLTVDQIRAGQVPNPAQSTGVGLGLIVLFSLIPLACLGACIVTMIIANSG